MSTALANHPYSILVVDDDPAVLQVTRMALERVEVDGHKLELVTCQSAAEARLRLADDEYAVAIVDVVMETEHAGLELVDEMRGDQRHQLTQIVVRTGEPGAYPARKVIEEYQISDYWPKAELRASRMRAGISGLLRQYTTAKNLQSSLEEKAALVHLLEAEVEERKRVEEERVFLEEQLRQVHKMEAIGQFAGSVAHDFNNLLSTIIGFTDLVRNQLAKDDPRREDLAEVLRSGRVAADLTQQLLAFSRLQILKPKCINLNDLLQNLRKMLRQLLREDIELSIDIDPQPTMIVADPGQIEQILLNLVVNAQDAMPRGGCVSIRTENVERSGGPGATLTGHHVVLTVEDTGEGMDPETLEHAFEPFYTTKTEGRGTGLGLATVHGIVHQSHGEIHVDSALGCGTTFRISLPFDDSRPADPEPQRRDEPKGGSETILLVEDDDAVRRLHHRVLTRQGYNVLEASNGVQALAVAKQYPDAIHLLLSDVIMPKMSAPELMVEFRQLRSDVEVLFLTGYAARAVQSGLKAHLVLQKPVAENELLHQIRSILDA